MSSRFVNDTLLLSSSNSSNATATFATTTTISYTLATFLSWNIIFWRAKAEKQRQTRITQTASAANHAYLNRMLPLLNRKIWLFTCRWAERNSFAKLFLLSQKKEKKGALSCRQGEAVFYSDIQFDARAAVQYSQGLRVW